MKTALKPGPEGEKPRAVVIGSGFGGLAAAVRLLAKGYDVVILERRDKPGGRASVRQEKGYTFDLGPTVITAPWLLDELWQLLGEDRKDHAQIVPIDPFYAIRFDDGTVFDYNGDSDHVERQIQQHNPDDVSGYRKFLEKSRQIFETGFVKLSDVPFSSPWTMAKIAPQMLRLESHKTVYKLVSQYIRNEKIRQVLSFHCLLIGGNPFTTTSIYALISWVERQWGVLYAMGGTGSLIRGLVDLIVRHGGTLRTQAEVEEIVLEGNRAVGVRLSNGEVIAADIVVSNADPAWTYGKLVDKRARRHWTDRKLARSRYSMGLFVWYFGTKRTYPEVKHHTILLGPRYKGLLNDIFNRKVLADDFSLYLHRPTATDPSVAPEGRDTFYVLSPVPNLDADIDWQQQAEPYRKKIQQHLEKTILPGLGEALEVSFTVTPVQFRDDLLSVKGAGFAMEPVLSQSAYFRPHNRSEDVEGLYLVGAGTHPGAGVPGVLSSAKVLERLVPDARERRRISHG
ncbi:MAG: phytoene desaturase [Myxococcota bacterium]|nr:phytoene desaturase [Myxococcota bacterium]